MSSPPTIEDEPGDAFLWSRVNARLRLGEGATSSSESPVSSAGGALEAGVPEPAPFRTLGLVAGLLPAGWECCLPEAVLGSLAEAVRDGGVTAGSSIR